VEGGSVLFVAKAEGPDQRMRMVPLVGAVAPLHATASGKVWLASLSEAAATAALTQQGLARLAPRTITSRARLLAQLRDVRAQGPWPAAHGSATTDDFSPAAPISSSRCIGASCGRATS